MHGVSEAAPEPPRRQGRGSAAGGLDAPHLTFHHHFLWQAETHLRRLPSACLGLNMPRGACQGLLARSWVWHRQLCAQPRPWLVPVQLVRRSWAQPAEAAGALARTWRGRQALPLPQLCTFPAPSLSSSTPAQCVSPCGTQTRPPTPPTPAERAVHSLAHRGRAPRMQWTEE